MANPDDKSGRGSGAGRTGPGTIALVVALFGILLASVWFAARAFTSVQGPPMPESGYVAMALGVGFSLLIGFTLMALLFYSNRHGYDEPARHERSSDARRGNGTDPR